MMILPRGAPSAVTSKKTLVVAIVDSRVVVFVTKIKDTRQIGLNLKNYKVTVKLLQCAGFYLELATPQTPVLDKSRESREQWWSAAFQSQKYRAGLRELCTVPGETRHTGLDFISLV